MSETFDNDRFVSDLRAALTPYLLDAYEVYRGEKPDIELSREDAKQRLANLALPIIYRLVNNTNGVALKHE